MIFFYYFNETNVITLQIKYKYNGLLRKSDNVDVGFYEKYVYLEEKNH